MKKICLLMAAVLLIGALCACSGGHTEGKELEDRVQKALGEKVAFVSSRIDGELEKNTFSFADREGTFEVISYVFTDVQGKEQEDLLIYYEEGIQASEQNRARRSELAAEYGIDDKYDGIGSAMITLTGYADLSKTAEFICALDRLYAFKETDPDACVHITGGSVSLPLASAESVPLSYSEETRLKKEDVLKQLQYNYILNLKRFGLTDENVPEADWNAVDPGFDQY